MYPAAGTVIWVFLGGLFGWLVGKTTHTDGPHGQMANMGVGALGALFAGFITTLTFGGERSDFGFWIAIAVAIAASLASVTVYRLVFPDKLDESR